MTRKMEREMRHTRYNPIRTVDTPEWNAGYITGGGAGVLGGLLLVMILFLFNPPISGWLGAMVSMALVGVLGVLAGLRDTLKIDDSNDRLKKLVNTKIR